jgi:hypothetical protein
MINALVSSVLLYGSVMYACMSDVNQTLTPTNGLFSKVEIFLRKMIRWVFKCDYDTRRSFLYVFANLTTVQVLAQKAVFRFFDSLKKYPRFTSTFVEKVT